MKRRTSAQIREFARDVALEIRTAVKCGKIIPNLNDTAHIWDSIERLAKNVEELEEKLQ